jgi:hypothetical protein
MLTLSHGFLKPQGGIDSSAVWFPALETNIQKLNDHTHNGTDAAQLSITTQTISSGGWLTTSATSTGAGGTITGGGVFYQTVTMPGGLSFDSTDIQFRLSTGEVWVPTVVRLSTTQYNIFTNDNTLSVTALYR